MKTLNDIARLRNEYEDRKHRLAESDLYSLFNRANLFIVQQRQREVLAALKKNSVTDLSNLLILEMGCGGGGVLTEYLGFGASPENLIGVDLLFDRLLHAHHRLPSSGFSNADGQSLPYSSKTFDLVLQYTAISSILDPVIRRDICDDMLRVLMPGGMILSYDFWLNPTNSQTRGIRPAETCPDGSSLAHRVEGSSVCFPIAVTNFILPVRVRTQTGVSLSRHPSRGALCPSRGFWPMCWSG